MEQLAIYKPKKKKGRKKSHCNTILNSKWIINLHTTLKLEFLEKYVKNSLGARAMWQVLRLFTINTIQNKGKTDKLDII